MMFHPFTYNQTNAILVEANAVQVAEVRVLQGNLGRDAAARLVRKSLLF
jgi:hypothetical protein